MKDNSSKSIQKRRKAMAAPLSDDLKKKYGFRSLTVRSGDKVRVLRGDFVGVEGEVSEVDTDRERILVEGVETATADEMEVSSPIHPSNVEITKLEKDKMRDKIIERRSEYGKERRERISEEIEHSEDLEDAEKEEEMGS